MTLQKSEKTARLASALDSYHREICSRLEIHRKEHPDCSIWVLHFRHLVFLEVTLSSLDYIPT